MRAGVMRVLGAMPTADCLSVRAAVLITDGRQVSGFGEAAERPYAADEQAVLRAAAGAAPETSEARAAAELVETAHAELLARFARVDLVGFHGQTLFHEPGGRGTHQAGSGAVLAEALAEVMGCPVVWDFRSVDLRMGGQGTPLAPFYHHALARRAGAAGPVAFLHLGRRAGLSWCDAADPLPEGGCIATDCGPGPGMVAALLAAQSRAAPEPAPGAAPGTSQGASSGRSPGAMPRGDDGQVDADALDRLIRHPWFAPVPRRQTGGPAAPMPRLDGLAPADAAATLCAALAARVAVTLDELPQMPARIWVTGPGRQDAGLLAMLAAGCDCPVEPVEVLELAAELIPAQAIAFLAARVANGLPTTAPGTTGVPAPVGGGALSRPGEIWRALEG